jgi:transposase
MRGGDERSGSLFSYIDLEGRVGNDHPLRAIRGIVNEALAALSGEFSALYSRGGRPSIPPEKLLRALLLQAFYSIRSGAAVDGAAGVRPFVPLVCRHRR